MSKKANMALMGPLRFKPSGIGLRVQNESVSLTRWDKTTFELFFKEHFKGLHAYAYTIVKDEDEADEVVQQVFCKLWERPKQITISGSVAAYLYSAVRNEGLNYLKHRKVKAKYQLYVAYSIKQHEISEPGKGISWELETKLREALNELPEQCRTVFQLSRFEELKYREIAEKLNISVKTVESHMGKALKLLRTKLADFLP